MRIFHLALRTEWQAALEAGSYTTSTLGRTLAEEGFIHASRGDQWQAVRERYYADVTEPLVLLVIDPARLRSPVVEEAPPGVSETFPHVYGPIDTGAVVQVVPLGPDGTPRSDSFSALFLRELMLNAVLGLALVLLVTLGAVAGRSVDGEWGALPGTLVALAAGVPAVVALHRRLSRDRAGSDGS